MVISKLCAHDNRKDIAPYIKGKFSQDYQINRFMADKALLRFGDGKLLNLNWVNGKWRKIGDYYVKFEE